VANAEATRASLKAQLTNKLLNLGASLAFAEVKFKTAKLIEKIEKSLRNQHIVSHLDFASTKLTTQVLIK